MDTDERCLEDMSVIRLRDELRSVGLNCSGNKISLINRLRNHFQDRRSSRNEERSNSIERLDDNTEGNHENPSRETKTLFTFRDVEESFQTFTGDETKNVQRWIEEFEEYSQMLNWNELQKFIYGKRLLKGSAKIFVEFESKAKSWNTFKTTLTKEFDVTKSSALIHKQLTERKKEK